MRLLLLSPLLVACSQRPPEGAGSAVTVYWTVDTLGMYAAKDTGWCEHLEELIAPYGLDVACLEGAVPPAPWTGESHTRVLWPQHLKPELAGWVAPSCDKASVLETLATTEEGKYLFGADNPIFTDRWQSGCHGGNPWLQRTDGGHLVKASVSGDEAEVALQDDEDRPTEKTLRELEDWLDLGWGAAAYFNTYEAGGHEPRCWFDPYTEPCTELWNIAVDAGIVAPGDDRAEAWLTNGFKFDLYSAAGARYGRDGEAIHDAFWDTMVESIVHFRQPYFDERLTSLLTRLDREGRLDDVVIVVAGDHGENPCVPDPFGRDINCAHGEVPSIWTGNVPVFTIPADVGETWEAQHLVGSATEPWSLTNVSWGLLDQRRVDPPDDWPPMEAPGHATSWICDMSTNGMRIEGDRSLRCSTDECGQFAWQVPTSSTTEEPVAVPGDYPADFERFAAPTGDYDNWFEWACTQTE